MCSQITSSTVTQTVPIQLFSSPMPCLPYPLGNKRDRDLKIINHTNYITVTKRARNTSYMWSMLALVPRKNLTGYITTHCLNNPLASKHSSEHKYQAGLILRLFCASLYSISYPITSYANTIVSQGLCSRKIIVHTCYWDTWTGFCLLLLLLLSDSFLCSFIVFSRKFNFIGYSQSEYKRAHISMWDTEV